MSVTITVKWGKQKFPNVEVDPAQGMDLFKSQLFSLTNVPNERQKLMCKGRLLTDLGKLKAKSKVILQGAADVAVAPKEATIFKEDLKQSEIAQLAPTGAGLDNLGNTCYMNSSIQCLRHVPELNDALQKYAKTVGATGGDLTKEMIKSLGSLYSDLDRSTSAVTPFRFTDNFRTRFPQFGERSPKTGGYMQQDADECFSQLMMAMGQNMSGEYLEGPNEGKQSVIQALFGGEMKIKTLCAESELEPAVERSEGFTKIKCFIDKNVNYLSEGITKGLTDEVEKRSQVLGRNAIFKSTSAISKLPKYLVVQFVRFFYRTDTQQKAKILRRVTYPSRFDIKPHCADELKKSIAKCRRLMRDANDKKLGLDEVNLDSDQKKKKKKRKKKSESEKAKEAAHAAAEAKLKAELMAAEDIDTSGHYDIIGSITHKGRTADSGHYVGWAKQKNGTWIKFDDAVTSDVELKDIEALCGGGDHHMSYIVIYKLHEDMPEFHASQKKLEEEEKAAAEKAAAEKAAAEKAGDGDAADGGAADGGAADAGADADGDAPMADGGAK